MDARRSIRFVVLLGAAVTMVFGAPGPAGAASHAHNQNFAGYTIGDTPTTGTVSFTLPALTCTSTNAGIVPSLVFTNFTTNEFTSAGVYVQCFGGVPDYASLVEINNHFSFLTQTLNAGDKVRLNIAVTSKSTTVTITDTTNHSAAKQSVSGPGGGGSFNGATVGDNKIGSPGEPVAPFGTLEFTALKVNNSPLGAGGTLLPNDMYNGSTLQIRAGALSATATHFTTTFVHA